MQKEEQEKGFTKSNVDQVIVETNLTTMKQYIYDKIILNTIVFFF